MRRTVRIIGTEAQIYEQVASWMRYQHPGVAFHMDLAGVHNPSPRTRALYGRVNRRAWPDLVVAEPRAGYGGLYLEIKKDGTRIKKRNGDWASPHIEEQAEVLHELRTAGYVADFSVGFEQTKQMISSYLNGLEAA